MPETHYARNGDVHIAYQVFGAGDVTAVGLPGMVSNIEVLWENPEYRRYLSRLASFARVVIYDKRGQGMSDRDAGVPTLDERLDDLGAVIDATGGGRVALMGVSEGGSTAAMFAATHPERVSHLLLVGSFARAEVEIGDKFIPRWAEAWGTADTPGVRAIAPSKRNDPAFLRWASRLERQCTTPGGLLAAWRWIREIDVRPVLGSIQCPTLVLHRTGDPLIPVDNGRYLARHIPGARFVELEGDDHSLFHGDTETPLAATEEFLTGHAPAPEPAERVLATVLFTDIVDSTATAASIGDHEWRRRLDQHDEICRDAVARAGGRWVKSTGDGVLAIFDAPGRALACAHALRTALAEREILVRAGVHTGEIELRGDDVAGIGVNIAARVTAHARGGEVLVSRTVKDLVAGSGYGFENRGLHDLKGVPDRWDLLALNA